MILVVENAVRGVMDGGKYLESQDAVKICKMSILAEKNVKKVDLECP